jgi:hypothetical protein
MNYKIIILAEAKLDIKEAAIWYNEKQAGLGKRFLNVVKDEVQIIKQNPLIYEIRYDGTRTALLKTFPYLIHFSIEFNNIIIKAVYHTSRNSSVWTTLT